MTEPVTSLDAIKAATTDEALLERAAIDLVQEFLRFVIRGKTTAEAIAELDSWRSWFETVRRNHERVF